MLTSERRGRVFYYTPTMTEEAYCIKESRKWVDKLADGRADLFVRSVAKSRELSEEEKSGLRELLEG